ncbi:3-hydroxyacyl-CoA dehydrogenase [Mycobacterium avium subsp. paratuberculosis]|uniref:3-hydroxyacyl-CoA dehydrogenase NAD-binding domain-containing protein n=1 Tax=Mycobacterium avium TaxID=1764 RepID=UPI0002ED095B|nr:3-hydroxyacyl-CoA dehydrogenase NAD-binding domain-containing protein [Mycobacterium avium]QQK50265.1 3-hydroxyacyl-CoA dehydrogenase [Mycobacterium avium subsp. paratuberculosis]WAI56439.1 3-hydroxyacyl-CoA dehydrogenase NAD-binding domain-containing protein [Mycobacterium avium subsp. paratuberculosis]
MSDSIIGWDKDADGIVTLTIDDPDNSANMLTDAYVEQMGAMIDRLEAEVDETTGVVITSGKSTFFAGADLTQIRSAGPEHAQQLFDGSTAIKRDLRRLETLGKPVVAAINGAALSGGLELALATHHRIAANVAGSVIGLPEVMLGVLPGAGGVARSVRLLGIQNALMQVLLTGNRFKPAKAQQVGLVDELVESVDELVPAAKAWILANPGKHVQPWDVPGFEIPGGSPSTPAFAANLPAFPANLRKQLKGSPMPAPRAIMAAALEGAQVDFDTAQLIETRYFVNLVTGPIAKNMIQAFFFDLQAVQSGTSRPADAPERTIHKVGILGAGMMGAGIAYVTAKAGIDVVLKDVTLQAARKGKAYSENLEQKALAKGRTTEAKSRALLDRITPTADAADFTGVDFVIEAVFENTELKNKVFAEIENIVEPGAVLGSNTSSLPITELAAGVSRPENFVGIHFFSPVEKMDPIEIIRGAKTSDETLARVIDYTLAINKYPIVVNDGRGFFTTRVFSTYLLEAFNMLAEGIDPATIEQAALQAGYPAGPLQVADELSFGTIRKIMDETVQAAKADGVALDESVRVAAEVVTTLMDTFDRTGKKGGAGFYDYVDGTRAGLWDDLRKAFNTTRALSVPFDDLQDRYLFIQAIETQKAYDDGVISSDPDANIGSIFSIGYPPWTGGVRQFVTGYPGGIDAFRRRADELAARYGGRFRWI